MSKDPNPEDDAAIVRELLAYDEAKRAFAIAKKMSVSDMEKIARAGHLTVAEDAMMRAAARDVGAHLLKLRELLGT